MSGTVYLVGAGPGAADLLTLRAARVLADAAIVFHDALVPADILAMSSGAKVPVGKRSGRFATAQHFINKRLLDAAREHRIVVRLKGGDPMLFGRAHDEISFLLQHGVGVEVVPGVTAALAASAELGISLTRRGVARTVAFVTPRVGQGEAPSTWVRSVLAADTAAIYMGAGESREISSTLIAVGMPAGTPVAVVENASLKDGRREFGTLGGLAELAGGFEGPTLILLGEVFSEAAAAARRATARTARAR